MIANWQLTSALLQVNGIFISVCMRQVGRFWQKLQHCFLFYVNFQNANIYRLLNYICLKCSVVHCLIQTFFYLKIP